MFPAPVVPILLGGSRKTVARTMDTWKEGCYKVGLERKWRQVEIVPFWEQLLMDLAGFSTK